MKVSEGRMTSSPRRTPASRSAVCSAAVPLLVATAGATPKAAANPPSKRSTNGPTDDPQPVGRPCPTYGGKFPPMLGTQRGTGLASGPGPDPGALDGILDRKPVQMSAQPLSRAPQPLVKRDPRFPTEQVSRAGRIRLQHHHLAVARADPI